MGKITKDFSCYVPRNPNVGKINLDRVLQSRMRQLNISGHSYHKFAYRMRACRIDKPEYKTGLVMIDGMLNCFEDGFLFFPAVDPGLMQELVQAIGHATFGSLGESFFFFLGEGVNKVVSELAVSPYAEAIFEKMRNKKEMFRKALASKDFFFIPYAEITRFKKRTEHFFLEDTYTYIISRETDDGSVFHYMFLEKSGYSHRLGGCLDEQVVVPDRLQKEVEEIAYAILREKFGDIVDSYQTSYIAISDKLSPGQRAAAKKEFDDKFDARFAETGYTDAVLDLGNINFLRDKKLAEEIREKISCNLAEYKKLPENILESVPLGTYEIYFRA